MFSKLFGKSAEEAQRSSNWIFATILIFSMAGLLASFVLSVEKLELLKNANAVLSCSINAVLNCASVMKTWQATLFGFPNSFIGMVAYPVLITLSVGYFAGAKYKRWFINGAQIGATLGLVFSYWLFFQSVYVIQVLCPWCLIFTLSTTIVFESFLRYNLLQNNFNLPKSWNKNIQSWLAKDYDKLIVISWVVLLVAMVLIKFPGIFS